MRTSRFLLTLLALVVPCCGCEKNPLQGVFDANSTDSEEIAEKIADENAADADPTDADVVADPEPAPSDEGTGEEQASDPSAINDAA